MTSLLAICALGLWGAIIVALLWVRPKLLLLVTVLGVMFVRTATHLTGITQLSAMDDALVVLCLVRAIGLFVQGERVRLAGGGYFAAFGVFGVVSGLLANVPSQVLIEGTFLALKGIVVGGYASMLRWGYPDLRAMKQVTYFLVSLLAISGAVNLLSPQSWASVFSVNGTVQYRFGLPSLIGPFIHPFDLAFVAANLALALLVAYQVFGSRRARFAAILMSVLTLATFRKKDIAGLVFAGAQVLGRSGKVLSNLLLVFAFAILVIIIGPKVAPEIAASVGNYLSDDSQEARTVLTFGAADVANNYFPFGSGFGTFASRTAAVYYSPEYVERGWMSIHGMGPGELGFFLTDTSWPAIIGEAGWIGGTLFAVAFAVALRRAWLKLASTSDDFVKFSMQTFIAVTLLYVVQSVGAAVFTSPPMFAIYFAIYGIASQISHQSYSQPDHEYSKISIKGLV